MIQLYDQPTFLVNGTTLAPDTAEERKKLAAEGFAGQLDAAGEGTIAHGILAAHNTAASMDNLRLKFDSMASHDITYVGIVQTAKVSGLQAFPMPYVLTNCHNSLGAVGGTINEDDHMFGLSAAQKYGGIYVPPHLAVIHSYMREAMAGCGRMILGSDSHTRYGALGTMAVGEGGGELVKQLLEQTYDMPYPKVVGIYLSGAVQPGVGPQDVALAIIGAVFASGLVKNAVMEFVGPGIAGLSADFRSGIDVMTTETTCWSSIWQTDEVTRDWLALHGRADDYKPLSPAPLTRYGGMVTVDLSAIKPMIAMPFHPSNTYEIDTVNENLSDIMHKVETEALALLENPDLRLGLQDKIRDGKFYVEQGVIAGCSGGIFGNVVAAANILDGRSIGNGPFSLSVYPASQPVLLELTRNGVMAMLIESGATMRTAFCGPCFGAGDVPANGAFSIRHTTRNFPSREGSKPMNGQVTSVALMDARSIAATALNGGALTSAQSLGIADPPVDYHYDDAPYKARVYYGFGHADPAAELHYGPNIVDWPEIPTLGKHLLVRVDSFITDPVTTTDELIPSGETSSYRSNPLGLAEFTLSRRDPGYVGRAKEMRAAEADRTGHGASGDPTAAVPALASVLEQLRSLAGFETADFGEIQLGSSIFAKKPGDGSAREQAASCQRVLGGAANFANEYATKRYRSNLINWGMLPFLLEGEPPFALGDFVLIPRVREALAGDTATIDAFVLGEGGPRPLALSIAPMTDTEKEILLDGCLINYNRGRMQQR